MSTKYALCDTDRLSMHCVTQSVQHSIMYALCDTERLSMHCVP